MKNYVDFVFISAMYIGLGSPAIGVIVPVQMIESQNSHRHFTLLELICRVL